MGTIRDKGIAMLAIERDVKERIKQLAGDTDIYVKVREIVDYYEYNNPQVPMSIGSPIHDRDTQEVQGVISAVQSMAWVWYQLLTDGTSFIPERNKALHELWDRSVKELSKSKIITNAEQGRLIDVV